MAHINHDPNPTSILESIVYLTTFCAGPQATKDRLLAWAERFALDSVAAANPDEVKAALKALIVISHANASFEALPPGRYSVDSLPDLAITDRGGFVAARLVAADIVRCVDFEGEKLEDLTNFTVDFVKEQLHQIARLLKHPAASRTA